MISFALRRYQARPASEHRASRAARPKFFAPGALDSTRTGAGGGAAAAALARGAAGHQSFTTSCSEAVHVRRISVEWATLAIAPSAQVREV